MKKSPLKRKKPLVSKAKPKAKKTWLKADGTPKKGYTKRGTKTSTSVIKRADRLARKACHDRGYCEAAGWGKRHPPKSTGGKCKGRLCWCHIIGRTHKTIRWMPENCCCLCDSCHRYFHDHPKEWSDFIEATYPGRWDYLYSVLQKGGKPDPEAWIEFYRKEAA